ncbi:MAG: hypothetical protein LBJ65_04930 [Burkholderia sp.]|jgi:hypothetical protein|uniref:hypothetical protein n=1 Tax=Burkholderia sp. TaxID=36773 RepID=UPI0028352384|nr:hypothetical protein [Burkholderia sp.]MDR0240933.1 hypothetical protein [Burkholderia sp.]
MRPRAAADNGHRPRGRRLLNARHRGGKRAAVTHRHRAVSLRHPHETTRIGRSADFRAFQSRFKIFLTNESSCAVSVMPRTFSRENRQFIAPDTHEKRIARMR